MSSVTTKIRSRACDFIESVARFVLGQPVRIVTESDWDRLERLAYRHQLRDAAQAGNQKFIEDEIQKNQLTPADLERLKQHHTPLSEWPDSPDDLIAPEDFGQSEAPPAITEPPQPTP